MSRAVQNKTAAPAPSLLRRVVGGQETEWEAGPGSGTPAVKAGEAR